MSRIPDEESDPTGIAGISGAPELTRCTRRQLTKPFRQGGSADCLSSFARSSPSVCAHGNLGESAVYACINVLEMLLLKLQGSLEAMADPEGQGSFFTVSPEQGHSFFDWHDSPGRDATIEEPTTPTRERRAACDCTPEPPTLCERPGAGGNAPDLTAEGDNEGFAMVWLETRERSTSIQEMHVACLTCETTLLVWHKPEQSDFLHPSLIQCRYPRCWTTHPPTYLPVQILLEQDHFEVRWHRLLWRMSWPIPYCSVRWEVTSEQVRPDPVGEMTDL